ncbi:hypothetical protein SKAU_G00152420 [Synaphobranchus kaupii]|uniref:Endoplasmic reticulum lectin n=1 Tax=Synaphobranchus kaupii TaxID=118154 RepID=A0A9Q1FGX5_SYNKA|nr:hypothetical protein SKAU_G00152420 [Synaphobranchus kaupii]
MAASMVRWLRGLYIFFLTCLLTVSAFLNLDELNEMKYGIQILPDPVIMGQAKSEEVMLVSNKYRQLYECRLPAQAVRFHQDPTAEPDPQGYSGPGISELLKPMHGAPCLVKTKDWWTYEFCYGQHVRQYHLDEAEVKGDVLFLGYYESEFDWNNETAKASKQHRLKRYHSQSYANGSKCDLNGRPRETEVRFLCEEGSGDYVARVDEPQSCRYVLTVHTTRTCHHPFLRPPSTTKPHGIVCQPALSPQQYMDYVKAQVSDTKRKVEQISEELKNLDEILAKDENAESRTGEKTAEEDSAAPSVGQEETVKGADDAPPEDVSVEDAPPEDVSVEDAPPEDVSVEDAEDEEFWEKAAKPDGQAPEGTEEAQTTDRDMAGTELKEEAFADGKFNFKIITDPSDLMKFVKHLKENNKKVSGLGRTRERGDGGAVAGQEEAKDDAEEGDEEDERLLQEFEEEMADLSVPSAKIDTIKEEMQKEFDNIIDEAQQELETEGLKGEFDRGQATQTLETTLDKLLDRLEDKEVLEPGPEGELGVHGPRQGQPEPRPPPARPSP